MDGPSASNSATAFCIGMNFILGAEGGGGGALAQILRDPIQFFRSSYNPTKTLETRQTAKAHQYINEFS